MLMLAPTRLLEIIGEAAKNVFEPTRALAPAIPWREIAGTRDRIAHGYFDINLDIVWEILSIDLPKLLRNWTSCSRSSTEIRHPPGEPLAWVGVAAAAAEPVAAD